MRLRSLSGSEHASYWSGRDGITNLASSGSFRETACAEASLSVVGMWSVRSGPDPTGPVRISPGRGGTPTWGLDRNRSLGSPLGHTRSSAAVQTLTRGAVFYARYENAFGKLWETLNPADPRVSFKVRRAWLLQLRNWYQRRRRRTDERIVERRNAETRKRAP